PDDHDLSDRIRDAPRREECRHLLVAGARLQDRRSALVTVTLADEGIDDVDLDRRVSTEVRDGSRRADVREDEMVVVPDRDRAFGRKIGCVVGAHGGDERETLLAHDALHVIGEDAHRALLWAARACPSLDVFLAPRPKRSDRYRAIAAGSRRTPH